MAVSIERPAHPRTLAKSVTLTFLGQLAFVGLGILSGVLTARVLGPAGKGQLATLFTLAILLSFLVSLGLDQAIVRVVASGRAAWRNAVSTVLLLYGGFCLILLPAAAVLLHRYHLRFFPDIPLAILYVALAVVPLRMIISSLNGALAGHHRLPEVSALQSVQVLGSALSLVVLVWIWRFGVLGGIIAQGAGIVLGIVVALYLLRRVAPGGWGIQRDLIPEMVRFGRGCYAATIAQSLNWRFDTFLVFSLLGAKAVGFYTVAVGLAELPQYLPNSIANVLMPRVSGEAEDTAARTALLSRAAVFVLLLAYGGLLLLGYPLIRLLYSHLFLPAYPAMALLLPGLLLLGQSRILAADITGRGFPRYPAIAAWISLGVTIGLDLLLIPRWGILGAACGAGASYLVGGALLCYYYRRLTGVGFRDLYCLRPAEARELCRQLLLRVRRQARTDSSVSQGTLPS